jgi:hypothetical protein
MERDTVLVIGAGASFGARATDPRPPLGSKLAEYLRGWFDANAPRDGDHMWSFAMSNLRDDVAPPKALYNKAPDVRPILVRAAELERTSVTAFEEVMAELLRSQARRLLDRVNRVIALALLGGRASAFTQQEDLYDQLFSLLRPSLRSIVTPNYDLLSEEALERVGLAYRYRGISEAGDAGADVVLDKFHGSANWFQPSGIGRSRTLEAAQRGVKPVKAVAQAMMSSFYNDSPVYAPPAPRRKNAFVELKRGIMPPVLVTYGPGKDAMHSRPHLDRVRAECAADLRQSLPRRVIAFGISPPRRAGDDDAWESLCRLFSTLPSAKEYWSGNPQERDKMAAYGFEGRDGWFDGLLASLR